MVARKEMSIDERRKYLSRMLKRYQAANRTEKGKLLDEMELVTQMHRKSIIRLLNAGSLDARGEGGSVERSMEPMCNAT